MSSEIIEGCWCVGEYKTKEKTLFEILKNNKWIMIRIEEGTSENFFCIPLTPLTEGDKVRIKVDL